MASIANEAARRKQVREIFLSLAPEERSGQAAVLSFYVWLREHHPELLSRTADDPYQLLELDLEDLSDVLTP